MDGRRPQQLAQACMGTRVPPGRPRPGAHPLPPRHSFASLLLAEGRQALYVAQQLGHTPAVLLNTYAHLLPELAEAERVEPELEIAKARAERSEEHTSELQSRLHLVCRLLL